MRGKQARQQKGLEIGSGASKVLHFQFVMLNIQKLCPPLPVHPDLIFFEIFCHEQNLTGLKKITNLINHRADKRPVIRMIKNFLITAIVTWCCYRYHPEA